MTIWQIMPGSRRLSGHINKCSRTVRDRADLTYAFYASDENASISQIIDSDVIYVQKEGRIVEVGTHDELYDRDGKYLEIFTA